MPDDVIDAAPITAESEPFDTPPRDVPAPEGDAGEDTLSVNVDGFEGPLDLLLMLARTQKVDLRKISVLQLGRAIPGIRQPRPGRAPGTGGGLSGDGGLADLPEIPPVAAASP